MIVNISVIVICVKAIIYLLLYNFHDCIFKATGDPILYSCDFEKTFRLLFSKVCGHQIWATWFQRNINSAKYNATDDLIIVKTI